ncbi:helix-turn-helix domain-containing protein [uncultured Oscillibacter sp.]|uniref:helix-turn-helix domain-containing protein n=1 Tax=uncultured Oscillibacter sp. TaxID=876091 RepID=UPI0025E03D36|nr:helix-turn-helix domain-containing protein [uncultured Oscillibacter sp.]
MKIGVIGPSITVNIIKNVAQRDLSDVQFIYHCSEFYEQSAEMAAAFQADREVDAILFTGPTNFAYARKRVAPTIPWSYLPHSRTAALQALLEAVAVHGSDLKAISLDRYEPPLMRQVLERAGIHNSEILLAPYDFEEPGYEKKLQDFHRGCYLRGEVSACFTSMEHIMEPLVAEGIPCVRIYPAEEIVQEQVYHLQVLNLSARENQGKLAVIAIHFDYTFDSEQDLFIREWEKVQYQNEFRERVYTAAQRMEAAVFGEGLNHFFIVTTRSMLMNAFLKNKEHWKLLQFGQRSAEFQVWMGIGIGNTMLESKSRAAMALNHAVREHSGTSFLMEEEGCALTPLDTTPAPQPEQAAAFFARKIQVSMDTLSKIRQCLRTKGDTLTSDELAQAMGITARSVNRIITRLEEEGCVTVVGRRSTGKGRPARVMKITLPDSLCWEERENPFFRTE